MNVAPICCGIPQLVLYLLPRFLLLRPLSLLLLSCVLATLFVAQAALQEREHGARVPETLGVAAARFLQGSAPHRLTVTIPRAPHPEHVGKVASIRVFL